EIDLSIAAVIPVSGLISAVLMTWGYGSMFSAFVAVMFGVGVGLANGIVTVAFRIPSFVVTLGMMGILQGLAQKVTNTNTISISNQRFIFWFGGGDVGPIPILDLWSLAALVVGVVILNWTALGRKVLATGANRNAARFSGIRTGRIRIGVLTASGAAGAIAGLLYTGRSCAACASSSPGSRAPGRRGRASRGAGSPRSRRARSGCGARRPPRSPRSRRSESRGCRDDGRPRRAGAAAGRAGARRCRPRRLARHRLRRGGRRPPRHRYVLERQLHRHRLVRGRGARGAGRPPSGVRTLPRHGRARPAGPHALPDAREPRLHAAPSRRLRAEDPRARGRADRRFSRGTRRVHARVRAPAAGRRDRRGAGLARRR